MLRHYEYPSRSSAAAAGFLHVRLVSSSSRHPRQHRECAEGVLPSFDVTFHSLSLGFVLRMKFQQEMLYGQIRYYRTKMQQYKGYVERLKHDSAQLRKINDTLSKDNEYLKQSRASTSQTRARHHYDNHNQEPASFQNGNNKRPMTQTFSQYPQDQDLYLSSSPRSIVTPIGPNRITLPAGHQAPTLSAEKQRHPDQYRQQHSMTASVPGAQSRPGSSRQLQQYAYAPPETSQFKSPALTKTQAAPKYFQRTSTQSNTMANTSAQSSGTWVTRQESGRQEGQTPSTRQTSQFSHSGQPPLSNLTTLAPPGPPGSKAAQPMQRQVMGPPPTPQRPGTHLNPLASNANQAAGKPSAGLSTSANRRFVPRPGNIQSGASKQQVQGQQFSRTPRPGLSGSGQRQPFLPSGSN